MNDENLRRDLFSAVSPPQSPGDEQDKPGKRPSQPNYHLVFDDEIDVSGPHDMALANRYALHLLYQLEEGQDGPDGWQNALAKYRGYGGISTVLDPRKTQGWEKEEYARLEALLTPDDLRSVQRSTPYAFYTPPKIIRAIWDGLALMGFAGGRVLEPGMGNGLFFAAMPEEMAEASFLTGVEIDQVSGRIAQQLFPQADIYLCGLQDAGFPDGSFDLVIGNVPFGQIPVYDEAFADQKHILQSIHRYFMAKAVNLTRVGGLVGLIVSRHFMDSKDDRVRQFIAERAELAGAFRLPVETFRRFARTSVTSDLLIFQRVEQGNPDASWVGTGEVTLPDVMNGGEGTAVINQHFIDYPDMMIGRAQLGSSQHGPDFELVFESRSFYRPLAELMRHTLPLDIYAPVDMHCPTCGSLLPLGETKCKTCLARYTTHMAVVGEDVPEFAYFVGDHYGRVYQNRDGVGHLVEGAKRTLARIAGMIKIRDIASDLYELLRDPDADVTPLQQKLMWEYRLFVARYGFLNNNANRMAFRDDPDAPLLLALENWDEETETAKPAGIFYQRTVNRFSPPDKVELARDALFLSLNLYGHINWGYMEGATGRPFAELRAELDGEVFQTPHWDWQTADEYLSGDVALKLAEAKRAAAEDDFFTANVQALEAVLPDRLSPDDITASLGASWIPVHVVEQFANELLIDDSLVNNLDVPEYEYRHDGREDVTVRYWPEIAEWSIGGWRPRNVLATERWGTKRAHALDLMVSALNGRSFAVFDTIDDRRVLNEIETLAAREKMALIKDAFRRWVWRDETRSKTLAGMYNETFNVYVPRRYDGSHLVLPGLANDAPAPRPNQKDAIWRGLQGDHMLVWHDVGYGKTFIAIALSMEMRRLGLRNKIMHVVPNNRIMQHATEAYRLYPGVRLLLVNSKRMSARRRAETMARIVTGDYDMIIVTHSAFKRIPVSDETYAEFIGGWVDVLDDYLWELDEDDPDEKLSVKQIQAQKERFEAKLDARKERARRHHDTHQFTWERLGIDMLIVDECHHFKNVWFPTKMNHLPGIGQADSDKAMDMFLKTQWLTRRCVCGRLLGANEYCPCPRSERVNNASLILMTATALDNSIAEIYTWQRYLQYDQLLLRGIAHFDAWARMFGDEITLLEMKPSGTGWRQNTRFMRFNNVGELNRMFEQVADMQTDPTKLGIVLPAIQGGAPVGIEAEPSRDFLSHMELLADRANGLDRKKPWEDNILMIMGEAAKAATHMWLVDEETEDDPGNKIQLCADEIYRYWQEFSDVEVPGLPGRHTLTQVVFCDIGTPKRAFNIYDYLRAALEQRGMPSNVIAYVHDAKTDEARGRLFQQMNEGKIHVLIGSTAGMGEGVNMHRLLKVMHELTPPWTPAKIKQRLGRIQRPGNLNDEIVVKRYTTGSSIEFYKWHLLEQKAQFIRQFMEGRVSQRTVEDISMMAIGFAEMKAMSSGDPLLVEKVTIETRLTQLYLLLDQYRVQRQRLKRDLAQLPQRIDDLEIQLMRYRQAVARYQQVGDGEFEMTIGTVTFRKRKDAAEAFMSVLNRHGGDVRNAAALYGFPIHLRQSMLHEAIALIELGPETRLTAELGSSASGNISRLVNALDRMRNRIPGIEAEIKKLHRLTPQYEQQLERPFDRIDELKQLEQQLADVEAKIQEKCDEEREGKVVPAASDDDQPSAGSASVEMHPQPVEPKRPRKPMQAAVEDLLQTYGLLDAFRASDEFHARFEMPHYMPLVIERIGFGRVSVAHYYTQNGDAVADPDVVYDIRNWIPQEITQPPVMIAGQVLGGYQEIVLEDGRFYPERLKDVESFSRMWAKNIREQGWFEHAKVVSISHPELVLGEAER